jgi:septal ring factor EnvC (AmiA/AmiB activator)
MAAYSLADAASACGLNRTSILRAIKSGRISAARDQSSGQWRIEPAELHRVFPVAEAHNGARSGAQPRTTPATAELREVRARLAAAEQHLLDMRATIDDLRRRLDAEADERRASQERLAALLPPPQPRSWWRRR